MSTNVCVKEESKDFVFVGDDSAPSWAGGDISPLSIASGTGKVVLVGLEQPDPDTDTSPHCISVTDSGSMPATCTLLPLSINEEVSIILI